MKNMNSLNNKILHGFYLGIGIISALCFCNKINAENRLETNKNKISSNVNDGKEDIFGEGVKPLIINNTNDICCGAYFCRNDFNFVKICEGVRRVGQMAFTINPEKMEDVESFHLKFVSFPKSLCSIGYRAFLGRIIDKVIFHCDIGKEDFVIESEAFGYTFIDTIVCSTEEDKNFLINKFFVKKDATDISKKLAEDCSKYFKGAKKNNKNCLNVKSVFCGKINTPFQACYVREIIVQE